jgi:hypothetical protein
MPFVRCETFAFSFLSTLDTAVNRWAAYSLVNIALPSGMAFSFEARIRFLDADLSLYLFQPSYPNIVNMFKLRHIGLDV